MTNKSVGILLSGFDTPLIVGQTYPITLKSEDSLSAEYVFLTNTQSAENPNIYSHNSFQHFTTNDYHGVMTVHHIGEENQIISVEFYFDCINTEHNETTEIAERRFDLIYEAYF